MGKLISIRRPFMAILALSMLVQTTISPKHSLAQTNMVGSLGGEMVVSPSGTASYTIPIEVPPGTNGMQPSLAITYNSAAGRGMAGEGWTLTGFSSITRTGRNYFFDRAVGSINFDENDRYALDGARLIKLSNGHYIYDEAEYGTEEENFLRVTLEGKPNTDSQYFTAVSDDGRIIEYGGTSTSRHQLYDKTFAWMVDRITDADSNYMTFGYSRDIQAGEIWPTHIYYTGNTAAELGAYASVIFQYTDDPNPNQTYVCGKKATSSKLLERIVVKYSSAIVRQYVLDYSYDRSTRLTAVILQDASGNELTRTTITWGSDQPTASISTLDGVSFHKFHIFDYNGDNNPDLLLSSNNNGTCQWSIKRGDGNGNYTSTTITGTFSNVVNLFTVDFNDDGRDDIGCVQQAGQNSFTFKVFKIASGTTSEIFSCTKQSPDFRISDFLGCGGAQFVFIGNANNGMRQVTNSINNSSFSIPEGSEVTVTDLNGNGKADIQVVRSNYIDVYEYEEQTGAFIMVRNPLWHSYYPTSGVHGDFNGDGQVDYVCYAYTGGAGHWYLQVSKGNDYTVWEELPLNAASSDNATPDYPLLVSDVNGDGMDDIIQPFTLRFDVYYSRGYMSNNMPIGLIFDTIQIRSGMLNSLDINKYRFADLDHDGKNEMIVLKTNFISYNPVVVCFPERREHGLVASVTDGLGKATSMEYLYYNSPEVSGYLGANGKRVRFPLVSKLRQPDGTGGTAVTTFTYGPAVFDHERRHLLGYGYFKSYSRGSNKMLEFEYNDTVHYLGLKHSLEYYKVERQEESGGYNADSAYWTMIGSQFFHHETVNTLGYHGLYYNRFVPYSSVSSSIDRLGNTTETVSCWLTPEGRVSHTSTVHRKDKAENGIIPWISRDSTSIAYTTVVLPNGKTAVRPSVVIRQTRRNGFSQTPADTTVYAYSSGRLATVSSYDSEGPRGVTAYTYNDMGLVLTETCTPNGMPERTRSLIYDPNGRFVNFDTDVLGHTRVTAFDPSTGKLYAERDANRLLTRYQYDALGRLTATIRPDGTVRNVGYFWNDNNDFGDAVFYVQETEVGVPETRTYYDILGRPVHTYCEGQGYGDIVYDSLGRVEKKTAVPYPSTSSQGPKTWHRFSYDEFGRVVGETAPYTDLTYSYYQPADATQHDYFVTVIDNIRETRSTKTYDALGRLVQAEDEGGTVNYGYAYVTVSGKTRDMMTVTVGGAVTTVVSDMRGNRVSIQDPDAGTVTSTYDALNQLVSRTDANGNQAAYAYDLAGRVTQAVLSDGTETETLAFIYDIASGKGVGKLASIYRDGSREKQYFYDTLGRVSKYWIYDGDTPYNHQYAYDTLGRPQYFTYPDGFQIRKSYNSYGELESIRDAGNDSLIYAIDERDKFRNPLKCRYGNRTGAYYVYNSYGMPTLVRNGNLSSTGTGTSGGVTPGGPLLGYLVGDEYRELTYTYNSRGFIATKTESNTNQSESYYYDGLDRLTSYKVNGVTVASFTYGNNGNISSNSRVGSYSYGDAGPHAVTGIEGNLACPIPSSQCDVSYDLRNRPVSLTEGSYSISIDYDFEGMRRHTVITNGQTLVKEKTRISGFYELETTATGSRRLDYIYAEGNIVAVRVYENGVGSLYYVLTDHLGSWEKVLDQSKTVVQQTHFDPWGNRMSYAAWNTPQTQTSFTFDRGFTGHEHYDCMHVINANARLYDPVIGRFFSPDPYVQTPDFTQGFNRYSYCMNNPVMYSDPTGEVFGIDDVIIIGAMVGAFFGGIRADRKHEDFLCGMIKGAIIGALGGVLGGIGGAGMSYAENLFLGVWEGGFTGYVDGLVWGEDPGKSMLYGMASGAVFTTLTSENLWNALHGKGFKTNANVFKDFKAGLYTEEGGCWQQDALDYFGFEGNYRSIRGKGGDYVDGMLYGGSTNPENGEISFGELAFDSYDNLRGVYEKELFHRNRVLNGERLETFDLNGFEKYKFYPEEAKGFLYAGYNNGLYPTSKITFFNQADFYWWNVYGVSIREPRFYDFIFKIPRRW